MFLSLCFSIFAIAAAPGPMKEKWTVDFPKADPAAAFFDVASSQIFVSLSTEGGARLDAITLDGKVAKKRVHRGSGAAGPLRAHGGKIYWVTGNTLRRLNPDGSKAEVVGSVPSSLGRVTDLAIARDGTVFAATGSGAIYRLTPREGTVLHRGASIGGLFLLNSTLHVLRGGELQMIEVGGIDTASTSRMLCTGICHGLERTSGGDWVTAEGKVIREVGPHTARVLLEASVVPGRFAYVYQRDPKDDLLVVPFPAMNQVRAYRLP